MSIKFELKDKTSRKLRMTDWNWMHIIRRHPEITSEKEKIIETLENPDKITSSLKDENVKYYYKYYKYKSPNNFMMVLVKYLNGDGFVISSHFVSKIK